MTYEHQQRQIEALREIAEGKAEPQTIAKRVLGQLDDEKTQGRHTEVFRRENGYALARSGGRIIAVFTERAWAEALQTFIEQLGGDFGGSEDFERSICRLLVDLPSIRFFLGDVLARASDLKRSVALEADSPQVRSQFTAIANELAHEAARLRGQM